MSSLARLLSALRVSSLFRSPFARRCLSASLCSSPTAGLSRPSQSHGQPRERNSQTMLKLFGLAAIGRQKLPNGSATNDDHHDGTDSEVEMVAFDGDGAPLGLQEASSGVRKAVRPSSRALGKRKAPPSPDRTSLRSSGVGSGKRRHATDHALEGAATLDGAGTVSGGGIVAKAPSPKKKKKEEEKRMTRSSYARGGGGELQGDTWTRRKRSDSSDSENGWGA